MVRNKIIVSLLETDLYKFSMGQVIFHQFPSYITTWSFKCRNEDVIFTDEDVEEIRNQIKKYCELSFTDDEILYLKGISWLDDSYIEFLRLWHPKFEDFYISNEGSSGLTIEATGSWMNTSFYEIPTLAIVNEVYYRNHFKDNYEELKNSYNEKMGDKIYDLVKGNVKIGNFSEFGLRRRFSGETQDALIKSLSKFQFEGSNFVGTSNVYLAKKYGIKPVGTMAHEYIMCVGQGNHELNPAYSNKFAMEHWIKEYGVENGIMLTDTIGSNVFIKDFNKEFATLFSGVRHDSGDPILWGENMINKYKELKIDPKTKTLLFSDSLNFEKAQELSEHFKDRINVSFGIGTYLSNDTMVGSLNIVMKVTKCNSYDVAKLSDTPGKGMCKNEEYVKYLQNAIDWRLEND